MDLLTRLENAGARSFTVDEIKQGLQETIHLDPNDVFVDLEPWYHEFATKNPKERLLYDCHICDSEVRQAMKSHCERKHYDRIEDVTLSEFIHPKIDKQKLFSTFLAILIALGYLNSSYC